MGNKQYTYQNQYNREHYARLSVNIALSERESIDNYWKSKGYKSFNAFVTDLIRKEMNETAPSITVGDINNQGVGNTIHIG